MPREMKADVANLRVRYEYPVFTSDVDALEYARHHQISIIEMVTRAARELARSNAITELLRRG
jgi:hypothetical protein